MLAEMERAPETPRTFIYQAPMAGYHPTPVGHGHLWPVSLVVELDTLSPVDVT